MGADENNEGPQSTGPRLGRFVERVVAGERVLLNLDTGEMEPA